MAADLCRGLGDDLRGGAADALYAGGAVADLLQPAAHRGERGEDHRSDGAGSAPAGTVQGGSSSRKQGAGAA